MAAIMTSDFRVVDYYAREFNDPSFNLFSAEEVEAYARNRRYANRYISLTLTAQAITGTPLPDESNTDIGTYFEFIGDFESIGISQRDRYNRKTCMSQTNIYVNNVLNSSCYVDEIAIAVFFPTQVTGPVEMEGYIMDLGGMMADIFESIASDHSKLAIAQRMIGLSTDLTTAGREAERRARSYRGVTSIGINYTRRR